MSTTEQRVADQGLVGPRSVTWQLHADPAMWLAGITSLFLQALHPLAAAGVVQNSNFREDPLGRLERTARFVGLSTYGPTQDVHKAAERVRALHRTLRGKDPETGRVFRVDEPELLLWVHCAEVSTFLTVVHRAGLRLSKPQADRYLREQRASAALVGLHPEDVPGSTEEMSRYFRRARPELKHGENSAVVYRFLHRPPLQGPLRHGLPVYEPAVAHLAYSLLPSWAIRLYGEPAYPPVVASAMLRAARTGALLIPASIRWRSPTGYLPRAIRRLGPDARPSARLLPEC
ncbi:oxygenase MpaB family protein [Kutzneria viridogrisea]|uniref:ER-bound oxygenase mpaB/mpaB'/Rubber oxygenase catalytic domain-containing protein n=2 Tax=Kutzneria TaxID=43356 RepID=W5W9C2_9PSEU|nr:oxygenase MpaB family protein [Kutzneria albida]AHH94794.1 hypothetical protein KALB_1421 [Kutzneria albida DSM 43870]MBA8930463.1 uncharacterized protein (DUF2236 family) [Kutzneria viridogrisea]